MSIEALNWALRVPIGGNKKVVLLGMANHAGPDFCDVRPSVKTLATYAHCNERTVQRILRELEADGLIEKTGEHALKGRADRSVNVYRLIPTGRQNVIAWDDGVTPATERGDTGVANGVTPTPPEPSVEPSLEPSVVSSSSLEAVVEPSERQEPSSTSAVVRTSREQASNDAAWEIRELVSYLGSKIRDNGFSIPLGPEPPQAWMDSIRLMLTRDRKQPENEAWTVADVRALIDWATADDFWRTNIRSPQALRKHRDTLRVRQRQEQQAPVRRNGNGRTRWTAEEMLAIGQEYENVVEGIAYDAR